MFTKTKTYLLLFVATILSGCDDSYVSSIPDYQVNLNLNLTTTYSTFKNSTNQYLLFETRKLETDRIGYGGIIVCSGLWGDDSGNTIYYAFDLACPYEAKKDITVAPPPKIEDYTGRVTCEECGTVYDIGNGYGNPIEGPSKEVLKKYKATLSGDVLYIYR